MLLTFLMSAKEVFLSLHIGILLITIWNIFHADYLGLKWMRGIIPKLDFQELMKYHKRVQVGLVLMIVTGVLLVLPQASYLLSRPQFYIKMTMVLALIFNSVAIFFLMKRTTEKTFAELSFRERLPLFVSGSISTIGWVGATIVATFLIED